jgi:hypothetical protein
MTTEDVGTNDTTAGDGPGAPAPGTANGGYPAGRHGFTDPGRGEYPDQFVTEYLDEPDRALPPGDPLNPDYSATGDDHGFGWLGGPVGPAGLDDPPPPVSPPDDDFGDEAAIVRPYAWTRGRTKANYELRLETLISATELAREQTRLVQLEHRSVSALCRYPLSVAEVAAKLSIPLGVARVVLSDMAELGLISIHRTFADDDIAAHLVLMERVLSGLRRL